VEQAALAAEAIRKKMLAAGDLTGGKAAEKLPADEQELLDEAGPNTTSQMIQRPVMETLSDGRSVVRYVNEQVVTAVDGSLPTSSCLPTMVFVATISSTQRKALLAEAFGNAKTQAAELADATGGKLGAIRSLCGEVSNAKRFDSFIASPPVFPPSMPGPNENRNEATAADPGGLKFYAKVQAMFPRKVKWE
jgi:hypothetical protein